MKPVLLIIFNVFLTNELSKKDSSRISLNQEHVKTDTLHITSTVIKSSCTDSLTISGVE